MRLRLLVRAWVVVFTAEAKWGWNDKQMYAVIIDTFSTNANLQSQIEFHLPINWNMGGRFQYLNYLWSSQFSRIPILGSKHRCVRWMKNSWRKSTLASVMTFPNRWRRRTRRCRKQEIVISAGICVIGSNNFSNYVEHFAKHETFSAEIAINKKFKFSLRFLRFFLKQSPLHSNACMQCNQQEKSWKNFFIEVRRTESSQQQKKNFGKAFKTDILSPKERQTNKFLLAKINYFPPLENSPLKICFPKRSWHRILFISFPAWGKKGDEWIMFGENFLIMLQIY